MSEYCVSFSTTISLTVRLSAEDEDEAADLAWEHAEGYLNTLVGDSHTVFADATLDGIGASSVDLVTYHV